MHNLVLTIIRLVLAVVLGLFVAVLSQEIGYAVFSSAASILLIALAYWSLGFFFHWKKWDAHAELKRAAVWGCAWSAFFFLGDLMVRYMPT